MPHEIDRRTLLTSSLVGGFLGAGPAPAATIAAKTDTPAVDTTAGKVRGVVNNGVHVFRGVPYGASTAGANRFMPPRKPEPWTGIRNAYENGHTAPQIMPAASAIGFGLRSNSLQGEDCLVLNVFTPGVGAINDGHKRPVMVWIHGGGYTYSSGTTLVADGTNLARSGDATVVCLNHRLNIFGHLYLDEVGGAKYAGSGNLGMLDLVAALEWVRDNIAHFGGDPGNVTIFGQSGGGGKVSTLLAMPAAKGLFHKAIVESGSTLRQQTTEEAQKSTVKVLERLGLKPDQADTLQNLPVQKLLDAMGTARLGPVVDGKILPRNPFDPRAPDVSVDVPVIIGTAETEGTYFATPDILVLDEATMRSRLKQRLHDDSDRIIELFRKDRPNANPSEIYYTISAFPTKANIQAERKAALGKAPAYLYLINWRTPVQDGTRFSPHCLELPFVFNNVWHMPELVGAGPEIQPLANKVSGAWLAFARTGNPNHAGIPRWPAYDATSRSTMLINNEWKAIDDPHREERLAMLKFEDLPMT
jgi:para-nitrobenzyl esterase